VCTLTRIPADLVLDRRRKEALRHCRAGRGYRSAVTRRALQSRTSSAGPRFEWFSPSTACD